jgi:NADH-quinone oxidoreductase subunit J
MEQPQVAISSPFFAPTLTLALCVLAAAGTFLALPKPGRSAALSAAGFGMMIVAFLGAGLALLKWALSAGGVNITYIYFWIFAVISVVGAAKVVTHKVPVYSALYFVLTVFSTAGHFILLWAEFLAAALVIIYAGAILVTYTFVIMLASESTGSGVVSRLAGSNEGDHNSRSREPFWACVVGFGLMGLLVHVIFDRAMPLAKLNPRDVAPSMQELAEYLFTRQFVSLQVAGVILTLAMVGAMVLARKQVLVLDESQTADDEDDTFGPGEDNPHAVPVDGLPSPRAGARDKEMAEL